MGINLFYHDKEKQNSDLPIGNYGNFFTAYKQLPEKG
jgi:hypothetical protein